jgi:endo-alpha-1,4-polygalactosaminidase (GH114 family)
MKTTIETLTEEGCEQFDRMQENLTSIISATDAELEPRLAERNEMAEMFGGECGKPLDCEGWREESRNTQDKLNRQGREVFAAEYAETQIKNLES